VSEVFLVYFFVERLRAGVHQRRQRYVYLPQSWSLTNPMLQVEHHVSATKVLSAKSTITNDLSHLHLQPLDFKLASLFLCA
jgi:hypothetical protein